MKYCCFDRNSQTEAKEDPKEKGDPAVTTKKRKL